ncbi:MAG TPA: response regulator [Chloroflexia bacterium]|nr:response regulator [Chloroflexia bacterium]
MSEKLVLVIEDEQAISEIIAECLTEEGYRVVQAYNPAQALTFLAREHCDLILLDLGLPGMDGNQFLDRMPEQLHNILVIMMTATPGRVRPNPRITLLLPKPFDLNRLAEKVCELVPLVIDEAAGNDWTDLEPGAAAF